MFDRDNLKVIEHKDSDENPQEEATGGDLTLKPVEENPKGLETSVDVKPSFEAVLTQSISRNELESKNDEGQQKSEHEIQTCSKENGDMFNISSWEVRNLKRNQTKKIQTTKNQPFTASYQNFNSFSVLDDGEDLCKNEPRENPTSGSSYQLLLKLQTRGKREKESEIKGIARQYKVCKDVLLFFKNVPKDKRSYEENKAIRKACYYLARMIDLHPEIQFLNDGTIREKTKKKNKCECSNKRKTDKRNKSTELQRRIDLNLMEDIQLQALMFIARFEKKRTTKIAKRARQHEKKQTNEKRDQKLKYEKDDSSSNFTHAKIVINLEEEEVNLTKRSNKMIDKKLLKFTHQDTNAKVDSQKNQTGWKGYHVKFA